MGWRGHFNLYHAKQYNQSDPDGAFIINFHSDLKFKQWGIAYGR